MLKCKAALEKRKRLINGLLGNAMVLDIEETTFFASFSDFCCNNFFSSSEPSILLTSIVGIDVKTVGVSATLR
jgi:hypothetical protein